MFGHVARADKSQDHSRAYRPLQGTGGGVQVVQDIRWRKICANLILVSRQGFWEHNLADTHGTATSPTSSDWWLSATSSASTFHCNLLILFHQYFHQMSRLLQFRTQNQGVSIKGALYPSFSLPLIFSPSLPLPYLSPFPSHTFSLRSRLPLI